MKMKENAVARNRNDVALENNFMFTTVMKNKKACWTRERALGA